MIVHFGLSEVKEQIPGTVVCIGTFDGVHRGHQAVIQKARAIAKEQERPLVVVTFDRHPAATLAPDREPPSLATLDENLAQIRKLGAQICVVLPFDQALASMTALEFFDKILCRKLNTQTLVIGHDFAFGRGREGTATWLRERVQTHVVEPWLLEGQRVSSSQIRAWVQSGSVSELVPALGRHFRLTGVVVKGQQLGRQLGYPTANLAPIQRLVVPKDGIYATRVRLSGGQIYSGATSIGVRPTVGGENRTIETFILDFDPMNLYGQVISVDFVERIRDELRFESVEKLVEQMDVDVVAIRAALSGSID